MSGAQNAPDGASLRAKTIARSDALRVAIASLISAGSGYVVLAFAARVLVPVENNTVFVTFWSTLFACFGVLSGFSIETTRAVTAATSSPAGGQDDRHPRVITVGVVVGLLAGLALAASSPLWAARMFATDSFWLAGLACLGVTAYAGHSVVVGSLAGRRSWAMYSRLIASEATVRLCLVLASVVVGTTLLGVAAGTAMAAFTWVAFLAASPQARRAAMTRADSTLATFLRRIAAASVATGSSAVLVVGFPVLLSLTTPTAQYIRAAPVLLAISLTRAPLMIPLNAYQGVAVSHFVAHRARGLRAMLPVARLILVVGLFGAALAYAVGPWVMTTLLGPGYGVSGQVLAGLTAAATFIALLTVTGALCQALTLHGRFVAGWVCAVVVAVLVLLLPFDLATRAVLALSIGPIAGIVLHLAALRRADVVASTGLRAG